MEHKIDGLCSCHYCQMVDIIIGDPLLGTWEKNFIENLARWGWVCDYTPKQKAVLTRILHAQRKKYTKLAGEENSG